MDVCLYEDEQLRIVKKEGFIYVKSTREVALDSSLRGMKRCNEFRLETKINKFLFVIHFNDKILETLAEDIMDALDSSLLNFMYEAQMAVVPKRKFIENMTMLAMIANTHNINSKVFARVRDAKAWLLEDL